MTATFPHKPPLGHCKLCKLHQAHWLSKKFLPLAKHKAKTGPRGLPEDPQENGLPLFFCCCSCNGKLFNGHCNAAIAGNAAVGFTLVCIQI